METGLKIRCIYSDEHMLEVDFRITTINVIASLSCYTQIEHLQELGALCKEFVESSKPFEWVVGSKEYSSLKMKFNQHDMRGHSKVDFVLVNHKDSTAYENMYCECCLMLEMGQIENLGSQIANLVSIDSEMIVI